MRPRQIWSSLQNCVFSCKVLCIYMVTNFLLVKTIFLCVPRILMKLKFAIHLVISLSSWWQLTWGKIYGLRCQNLSAEAEVGDLSAFVSEWRGKNREWSKIIYNQTLHEMLRQNRLCYTNVAVGNCNSNYLNILAWESERQLRCN